VSRRNGFNSSTCMQVKKSGHVMIHDRNLNTRVIYCFIPAAVKHIYLQRLFSVKNCWVRKSTIYTHFVVSEARERKRQVACKLVGRNSKARPIYKSAQRRADWHLEEKINLRYFDSRSVQKAPSQIGTLSIGN